MKPGMSKPAQQHRERRRGSVYPRALPIGAEMLGDINYDLLSKNLPSLGKLRRKRNLGCPCSSDSLCYISLSHLTILTYSSIPWRLGVGLSFQVIGFVLGVMNQCFLSLAPKFLSFSKLALDPHGFKIKMPVYAILLCYRSHTLPGHSSC